MKISQNGLKIIKEHEGLASKIKGVDFSKNTHSLPKVLLSQKDIADNITIYPYKCSVGKLTIGWGHTKTASNYINGCTVDKCEELLKSDLAILENAINQDINTVKAINGNQNKFDALICLIFNIGCFAFAKSTVRKCIIKNESKEAISEAWQRFNKVTVNNKKKENLGLTKRRKHEVDLFFATEINSQNTSKSSSFFSMDWTSSIVDALKNKGFDLIKDKGIDYVSSFIPGGAIFKDIAKSLLGNENANTEEVIDAIENATPEQLSNLKELLAQVDIEKEKTQQAIEKTLQEQEDTKQSEHQVIMTQIKEISHAERVESRKWFLVVLLINVLAYIGLEVIEQSWNIKIDLYNKTMLSLFSVFSILTFHEIMHPKVGAVIDTWLSIITLVFQVPNTLLNGVNNGLTGIGNFVKRK